MLPSKTGAIFSLDFITDTQSQLQEPLTDGEETSCLKDKLAFLEKWLLHGMSRFSKENLQIFLESLVEYSNTKEITSVGEIQRIIISIKLSSNEKLSNDEKRLLNYFNNFLKDISHIKLIHKTFDTEIYDYLFKHYYDPARDRINIQKQEMKKSREFSRKQSLSPKDAKGGHVSFADAEDTPDAVSISPRQLGVSTLDFIGGDENNKLHVIVNELTDTNERWLNLLCEDEIDFDDFDPDSEHELHHLSHFETYELVLRLIPDIFTKCHKCIELCKQWLQLAHKIYPSLPLPVKTRPKTSKLKNSERRISFGPTPPALAPKSRSANPQLERTTHDSEPQINDTRPVRPFTSKVRRDSSNSTGSSRKRIIIKKPRVAKFKPLAVVDSDGDDDTDDLTLNIVSARSYNTELGSIGGETYRIKDDSSEYSGSVLTGSFASTIPESEDPKSNLIENTYNYLVVKLRETDRNIDDLETNLKNYRSELDALHSREERIEGLQGKHKSIKTQYNDLKRVQNSDLIKVKNLNDKLETLISGTSKYFNCQQEIESLKHKTQSRENEMKILRFKMEVVEQDYQLENDVKSNFENFVEEIRLDIMETETLLEEERYDKLQLEKQIALHNPSNSRNDLYPSKHNGHKFDDRVGSGSRSNLHSELDYGMLKSGSQDIISDRYEVVSLSSSSPETTFAWDKS